MVINKAKEGFNTMRTIAKIVDRFRARKSVSCDELSIDRTALKTLQQADLSALKDNDAVQHDDQKAANA